MYHYSPVVDLYLLAWLAMFTSPLWLPPTAYMMYWMYRWIEKREEERREEQRERARERREERAVAAMERMAQQQPTLTAPYYAPTLPPPTAQQPQPWPRTQAAGWVVEQPSTALVQRRSRVTALAQAIDRLLGDE